MKQNFYENMDFSRMEYAVALEDVYPLTIGKFHVPTITPMVGGGSPIVIPHSAGSAGNIKNKGSFPISGYTEVNYLEIFYPAWLTPIAIYDPKTHIEKIHPPAFKMWAVDTPFDVPYRETADDYIRKGEKVIIGFVGGELNAEDVYMLRRVN